MLQRLGEYRPPPPRAPVVEAGGDGSWSVRALYRMLPPSSERGEWSRPCCLDKAITWNYRRMARHPKHNEKLLYRPVVPELSDIQSDCESKITVCHQANLDHNSLITLFLFNQLSFFIFFLR